MSAVPEHIRISASGEGSPLHCLKRCRPRCGTGAALRLWPPIWCYDTYHLSDTGAGILQISFVIDKIESQGFAYFNPAVT
jgi:hypothetical protein